MRLPFDSASGCGFALPSHEATTRNIGSAYPLLSDEGLGSAGTFIGQDLLGGSFAFDPFTLYERHVITNPNLLVFGQIGRGKSALVKTFVWRQMVFGRRAWIIDPKGEYRALAERCGVRPIALRPGGSVRLNPLETGGLGGRRSAGEGPGALRSLELVLTLAEASLRRGLQPRERAALEAAVGSASTVDDVLTLPRVIDALLDPSATPARQLRTEPRQLLEDGRDVALELRRLVTGDLRGMFDGPTTPGIDLAAPLVVLDLSDLYRSPVLGLLMTCAAAWLQLALGPGDAHGSRPQTLFVVDEAWAILANASVARWLQSSWKLSRQLGVSNIAVLHRCSDLTAVGPAGSEQVELARGLLSDSETLVVYGQPPGETATAEELLGLTPTEAALLPHLRRGVGLWKVGRRSFLVEHRLGRHELPIVDTDAAMGAAR